MSLFNYFSGKKDIKHSKFNMSFQNLNTSNFGRLAPAACYEVLGGDTWKVSQNTITKVAPMPSPAFTRIKQNFYSFFVPNQTVWKHWNDFITNGTEFLDTYGNNQTNQDITSQWQQPSISVNDLQLHTKLANGWALPIWRLNEEQMDLFKDRLGFVWKQTDVEGSNKGHFDRGVIKFLIPSQYVPSNAELESVLFSIFRATTDVILPSFFDYIPYLHPSWDISQEQSTIGTQTFVTLTCSIKTFAFCCDFHTASEFYRWLYSTPLLNPASSRQKTTTTLHTDSAISLETRDDIASWDSDRIYYNFCIRYFCDMFSDNLRLDHSPFLFEKFNFRAVGGSLTGQTLSSYRATRNLFDFQEYKYQQTFKYPDPDGNLLDFTADITYQSAGFYGRMFGIGVAVRPSDHAEFHIQILNGVMHMPFTSTTVAPVYTRQVNSIEDLDWVFGFDKEHNCLLCGQKFLAANHNSFGLASEQSYYDYFNGTTASSVSSTTSYFVSPFSISATGEIHDVYIGVERRFFIGSESAQCAADVSFSFDCLDSSASTIYYIIPSGVDIYSQDSFALGWDLFGFMVYNSKQVSSLLDYFNIPLEGFTARSWEDYAGELINCLPFFAYSKIWNDYFRNKTVSSAELDFCETNSVALFNYSRIQYLNILRGLNVPLSRQVLSLLDEGRPRSWVIPMSTAPKSGLSTYSVEFTSGNRFLNYTQNEFHYFNIQTFQDLFTVCSGFGITDQFVHKIINYVVRKPVGSTTYIELRGMLLNNVYLPNYYNGLFRLKFQNFSKDYFSSALLDPMHGANEVSLGDTISDLRSEIVEQNFWETFAMARSLKHAFQSIMGITPTHIEYDKPLLLGMDHMPINIGEVIQTSQTDLTPQGQRTGLAAAHGKSGLCKHYFNEGGYLIILSSFTLELQYFQGLEHQWTPFESFLDYPFIQFAHVGNESIPLRELKFSTPGKYQSFGSFAKIALPTSNYEGSKVLMDGRSSPLFIRSSGISEVVAQANIVDKNGLDDSSAGFDEIFGYIPRNSTYKFKFDQVHGAFRSQMDFWQTFRKFYKTPILTHEFVNWEFAAEDGDLNRLFFVEDDNVSDKFYSDTYINAVVSRPLPVVNVPSTK